MKRVCEACERSIIVDDDDDDDCDVQSNPGSFAIIELVSRLSPNRWDFPKSRLLT